jgi:hypothetical protein
MLNNYYTIDYNANGTLAEKYPGIPNRKSTSGTWKIKSDSILDFYSTAFPDKHIYDTIKLLTSDTLYVQSPGVTTLVFDPTNDTFYFRLISVYSH